MDDRTHQLTYSPDQPIHSKREDRFNRALFAQRIADTTATRSDRSSIVIGLYGPWGCGKSSTLNLIEEALNDHSNIVVVRFNPAASACTASASTSPPFWPVRSWASFDLRDF